MKCCVRIGLTPRIFILHFLKLLTKVYQTTFSYLYQIYEIF